jgi:hypothetical protein
MNGPIPQERELIDSKERLALLERIAASVHLKRATRLQELLRYLGKCSLNDDGGKIHEQKIGVEVFGRPEGYDTSVDNIVRTSVSELRKRIEAYFETEGQRETLVVEIPRWNYIPIFRPRIVAPTIEAEPPRPAVTPIPDPQDALAARTPGQRQWMLGVLLIGGVMFAIVSFYCVYFWSRYSALNRELYGWRDKPSVALFWDEILKARPDTDVVLADASFGLLQDVDKKRFPFDEYLNRSYIARIHQQDLKPEIEHTVSRIALWNLGSQDEFKLARRFLALDPLSRNIHLYSARDYMPDLTKRDNVILIGGSLSNPWDDLFESRMNFVTIFDNDGSIAVANRAPAAGERPIYKQTQSDEYCVVAYLPNPDHNGVVLLIEGTNAEATEAAGDFLLSEYQLSHFAKMLHVHEIPYFEVLLKVSSVPGTPLTSSIETYRSYPNLR